jgi:integrase
MPRESRPWFRKGKGGWYATVAGRVVSLGVRGRGNRKAAVEAWHRLLANGPTPPPATLTVGDLLGRFLADAKGRVKPKTLDCYRDFLEPFRAAHGKGAVGDLSPTLAECYSRKPHWSPSTRCSFLCTLVTALRWAERSRLIEANPLARVERPPKASRGATVLVTPEQHALLVAKASPQFALFLRVLWHTGARPGEVAAITTENFDPEAGLVRLTQHKTAHKGKVRVLYLPPEAVALLLDQRVKHPTGALLRSRNGLPWKGQGIVHAMRRLCRRAGLVGKIAYGYRHTFATDALERGVPDAQVAELLGHCGTAMLHRHYSHLGARAAALRAALSRVRE